MGLLNRRQEAISLLKKEVEESGGCYKLINATTPYAVDYSKYVGDSNYIYIEQTLGENEKGKVAYE